MYFNESKTCIHCRQEIPKTAHRCKYCLGNAVRIGAKRKVVVLPALVFFFVSLLVAGGSYHLFHSRSKKHVHFDQNSHSVMLLEKNASGIKSAQIPFRDVQKILYIQERNRYKLTLLLQDQREITFQTSKLELKQKAAYFSNLIGVQLETINRAG